MAISLNEAVELAKAHVPNIDNYTEQKEGFIFGVRNDMSFGGGNGPIVVLKSTGQCLSMPTYLCMGYPSDVISEGDIPG